MSQFCISQFYIIERYKEYNLEKHGYEYFCCFDKKYIGGDVNNYEAYDVKCLFTDNIMNAKTFTISDGVMILNSICKLCRPDKELTDDQINLVVCNKVLEHGCYIRDKIGPIYYGRSKLWYS